MFFIIGILIDLVSMICIILYHFGIGNERGRPVGPIFYLIGFITMVFSEKKSVGSAFLILLYCFLFYLMVIFSAVIVHFFVKFIRRLRAYCRKEFHSNLENNISAHKVADVAIKFLINNQSNHNDKFTRCDPKVGGYIYFSCSNISFKWAELCMLRTKEIVISVGENDPGDISKGRFAKHINQYGFNMENWQIGKRKKIVISIESLDRISQFIDVLFAKYYNCGDSYQLKAEVLVY